MKKNKEYPTYSIEGGDLQTLKEPVAAYAYETVAIPEEVSYAQIVDGMLQVTPDIEEEIAESEHGETVSFHEFKTLFSKWIEK